MVLNDFYMLFLIFCLVLMLLTDFLNLLVKDLLSYENLQCLKIKTFMLFVELAICSNKGARFVML